jgi:hypothetical protein
MCGGWGKAASMIAKANSNAKTPASRVSSLQSDNTPATNMTTTNSVLRLKRNRRRFGAGVTAIQRSLQFSTNKTGAARNDATLADIAAI